eukprot:COSAG01_NODE_39839_length_471_cov_1.228495_1_plen_101_part_01
MPHGLAAAEAMGAMELGTRELVRTASGRHTHARAHTHTKHTHTHTHTCMQPTHHPSEGPISHVPLTSLAGIRVGLSCAGAPPLTCGAIHPLSLSLSLSLSL